MLPDVVTGEGLRTAFYEAEETGTYMHRRAFEVLLDASIEPVGSLARIRDTAQAHWHSAGPDL
jgi:hypothetical protein